MSIAEMEAAERAARRHAWACTALGGLLIVGQAGSYEADPGAPTGGMGTIIWLIWIALLFTGFAMGGGLFRNARIRALINDEVTREHRRRALAVGFCAAMGGALMLYLATFLKAAPAGAVLRTVLTIGVSAALMSFGAFERRALG